MKISRRLFGKFAMAFTVGLAVSMKADARLPAALPTFHGIPIKWVQQFEASPALDIVAVPALPFLRRFDAVRLENQ